MMTAQTGDGDMTGQEAHEYVRGCGDAVSRVGNIIPADILEGEVCSGLAAGLTDRYTIRGVGLVPMRGVCAPEELTESRSDSDMCRAAVVLDTPFADAARSRTINRWAGTQRLNLVWRRGEADAQLTGFRRADGYRVIETNGDPIWEDEAEMAVLWPEEVTP